MPSSDNILRCDQLSLNKALKVVEYQNQVIKLSPTSFDLLFHLMDQSPSVVSVDDLLNKVWNNKVVNRESVKQQIKSLRDQLGPAASMIQSVRGFGYQIKPSEVQFSQTGSERFSNKMYSGRMMLMIGLMVMSYVMWQQHVATKQKLMLPIKAVVLPFKLLDSVDQDLVLLLQDELTQMLSKQADVKAISISATDYANSKNFSLQEYADQLDVDVLFEGAILESEDGYGINVRMIWAENSVAVWREDINVVGKNRNTLLNKTSQVIKTFIQKKVIAIKSRSS